jgi:hypothetical protein
MPKNKNINIRRIRHKRTTRNGEPAYNCLEIGIPWIPGKYELKGFDDSGVDYFDPSFSITSIGVHKWLKSSFFPDQPMIVASIAPDLYENPKYDCIWLR